LRAVNKELIALYWSIGKLIEERQETEGWCKAVVERLLGAKPLLHAQVLQRI
jgi:hypothetical protein